MTSPISSTQRTGLQRASQRVPAKGDYTGARQIEVQEEADARGAARARLAEYATDPESVWVYIQGPGKVI
jgi:hypothetical protein